MADTADAGEVELSFKVKTSGDKTHQITMSDSATVLDLKTKLAQPDLENIAVDRQRLIYSGRVMKNDDTLKVYKIKPGNTIHMVKSAASNPAPAPSTTAAAPASAAVPQNMAAGVPANNILAGLTGARFAGHGINLPGAFAFGPDGGMGAPPSEDEIANMLSDPTLQATMQEYMRSPMFADMLIQSNPMLANMPNAREILNSPQFRRMMTDPETLRMGARMRSMMGGGAGANAFPAPGVPDNAQDGAAANNNNNNAAAGQGMPNWAAMLGGGEAAGANPMADFMRAFPAMQNPAAGSTPTSPPATGAATGEAQPSSTGAAAQQPGTAQANPFAALFGGAPGGQAAGAQNPFGFPGMPPMTPEAMQEALQFMQQLRGAGSPAPPPDNRPPEEIYAEQLRQLNDMGFFDFDRNVQALRRSGGSVQGAIEHLLNGS